MKGCEWFEGAFVDEVIYYAHDRKFICVYVISNAYSNFAAIYKVHWSIWTRDWASYGVVFDWCRYKPPIYRLYA